MTSRLKRPVIDFNRYIIDTYQELMSPHTLEVSYDIFNMDLIIKLTAYKGWIKDHTGAIFSISKKIEYADELTASSLNFLMLSLKKEMDDTITQMDL